MPDVRNSNWKFFGLVLTVWHFISLFREIKPANNSRSLSGQLTTLQPKVICRLGNGLELDLQEGNFKILSCISWNLGWETLWGLKSLSLWSPAGFLNMLARMTEDKGNVKRCKVREKLGSFFWFTFQNVSKGAIYTFYMKKPLFLKMYLKETGWKWKRSSW